MKNEMLKGWVRLSPPRNREINDCFNWFRRWYLWKVYQVQCSGIANLYIPVTLYTQQALATKWSQRMWLEQFVHPYKLEFFFSDSADMIHRHSNWVAFFYLFFLLPTKFPPLSLHSLIAAKRNPTYAVNCEWILPFNVHFCLKV